jgi:hypothetical protein
VDSHWKIGVCEEAQGSKKDTQFYYEMGIIFQFILLKCVVYKQGLITVAEVAATKDGH